MNNKGLMEVLGKKKMRKINFSSFLITIFSIFSNVL